MNESVDASQTSMISTSSINTLNCTLCFETFETRRRPPKNLPCGHDFCEQCVLYLCCHQEYYLLDSINCPSCQEEVIASATQDESINDDLCKMFDESAQQSTNVTVIHVTNSFSEYQRKANVSKWSTSKNLMEPSRKIAEFRCVDCSKELTDNRKIDARHCTQCLMNDDCLRYLCSECSRGKHHGHQLITYSEIHLEHRKLIDYLRDMQKALQVVIEQIETYMNELRSGTMNGSVNSAPRNKRAFLNKYEAELKFALSVLENPETKLSPTVLKKIRQHQEHNEAKLLKMLHLLEKCKISLQTRAKRQLELKKNAVYASKFSLNGSSSQLIVSVSYGAAISTIRVIFAIFNWNKQRREQFRNSLKVLSGKCGGDKEKAAAFMDCAKVLKALVNEGTSQNLLLLLADTFLNVFYQLNYLVPKYSRIKRCVKRSEIWKHIQYSYDEIFKCAARHWTCDKRDRINLVDDLAFLCCLYSDVSDHATNTICMIEAARARAATDCLPIKERHSEELHLKQLDEHIVECRRIQKLQELSSSESDRFRWMKNLWRKICSHFRLPEKAYTES